MLGLNAQKTLLGIYNVNGREKLVCACKDFTVDGNLLYDFCSIKNAIIDSEHNGLGIGLWNILETRDECEIMLAEMIAEKKAEIAEMKKGLKVKN